MSQLDQRATFAAIGYALLVMAIVALGAAVGSRWLESRMSPRAVGGKPEKAENADDTETAGTTETAGSTETAENPEAAGPNATDTDASDGASRPLSVTTREGLG